MLVVPGFAPPMALAQLAGDASQPASLGDAWALRVDPQLQEHPLQSGQKSATAALADSMTGTTDTDFALAGRAELRRYDSVIKGDKLHYFDDSDTADAYGHVSLTQGGVTFFGPYAHMRVEAEQGYISTPRYHFVTNGGWGSGTRADLIDNENAVIHDGTYSTCQCSGEPAWYLRASQFDMDSGSSTGVARNAVLFFQGFPLFASPWLSFPLDDNRRTGLLPPTFSFSSTGGFDLAMPIYFNIAPNYDLTVTPRIISRRGELMSVDYRYLGSNYSGEFSALVLPHDALTNSERYSLSIKHDWQIGSGFSAYVNYNRVSDANVNTDLISSGQTLVGSTTLYDQEAGLRYANGPWSVLLREQRWQSYSGDTIYNREPQINVNYARYNVGGLDFGAQADASRFTMSSGDVAQGNRFVFDPYVSMPIVRPSWYITPKVQWHFAAYDLSTLGSNPLAGQPRNFTVNVPTVSLDSGMTFERSITLFGHSYIQTLEPRLYYVYTPYRNQNYAPLFDTAQSDFGLAEIFTTNSFVGDDRIADSNRITAAVTTRFVDAATGSEAARFVLAQQYSFTTPRVTLVADGSTNDLTRTGVIAGGSLNIGNNFKAEQAVEYDEVNSYLSHSSTGFSWAPEAGKVVNMAYRYTRMNASDDATEPVSQFIVSGQWPLSRHLSSVARVNFDMHDHRLIAGLVGFQYDADCWAIGIAFEKYTNDTGSTTVPSTGSRVLMQLQLKGLSKVDNGLLNQFKDNVPGYSPLPDNSAPVSKFTDYQ
ncbi:LPS-assembly protein LptD [Paraburkholderia sp. J67]|uniref:LPS-assembly protein LptD n=1 Tax=Paraburkholderia sp. J67 TaxID=2805435 RepID=UPI002ABE2912|nr:LPS-assembly protein LptD [Paraburkholderia sp. J67]